MNCPNCGASMHLDPDREALSCHYCNYVEVIRPNSDGIRAVADRGTGLACPVCRVELVQAMAGRHIVSCCQRCQGVLSGTADFMRMVRTLRSRARPSPDPFPPPEPAEFERRIGCPKCGVTMSTHSYCGPGNIVIDNCPRCELNWLDHHELERVVTAPDHSYGEDAWQPITDNPDRRGNSRRA